MFVRDNKLSSVKTYFQEKLSLSFSFSEIKFMFNVAAEERLSVKNAFLLPEDRALSESDLLFFHFMVKRLLKGEPFQQIIGFTGFYDLKIKVSPEVLTPRPETEELVYLIVNDLKKEVLLNPRILDVCSGSGCIALALKSSFPPAMVSGLEKSGKAVEAAKGNAQLLKLDVPFEICDVLTDDWNAENNSIDIIVSNPPYIMNSERVEMSNTVLDFEPEMALFVPDTAPLLFYEAIAEKGQKLLKEKGKLYFEINEQFGKETVAMLEEAGYQHIQLFKDLQGKDRMIRAVK
ncbi:MAG: peptide chain release factor N(5)-glutamine methyltransferase [Flavobacteriia bacterium]|nr:peptide chain release factor N(5)-glutamine methyltransferase [Flavobacteriia bacterium]OJX39130.1 MAG: protein-(glutamine-N5) methyltransferase, release factor-specific [Flavobacteriia bacterium 40-80]